MIRASFGIVDLEDDKVPGREHDVEIVRVDPEQDRGHSTAERSVIFCSAMAPLPLLYHSFHLPFFPIRTG